MENRRLHLDEVRGEQETDGLCLKEDLAADIVEGVDMTFERRYRRHAAAASLVL